MFVATQNVMPTLAVSTLLKTIPGSMATPETHKAQSCLTHSLLSSAHIQTEKSTAFGRLMGARAETTPVTCQLVILTEELHRKAQ